MATQELDKPIAVLIEHVPIAELELCHVLIVSCGLFEFDKIEGLQLESWPHAVRTKLEKEVRDYFGKHTDRVPRLVSTGVDQRTAFVVVHHAQRKQQ